MKSIVALVVAGLLSGCAGDAQLRANIAGANIELAKAQARAFEKPIVEMEVPQANGKTLKIVLRNPAAGQAKQVRMPDDPWARVVDRGMGVAGTLGGIWLGGEAAKGIVGATGSAISGALSHAPDPVIVTQPAPVVVEPTIVNPEIVNSYGY